MKVKRRKYYIDRNGRIKALSKEVSLGDIHRGIIFDNIEELNEYFEKTYGTILDEIYYSDLFDLENHLSYQKIKQKIKRYENLINHNKDKVYRFTNDWKYLNRLNNEYSNIEINRIVEMLSYQESLAYFWETRTKREFSPFTNQIYTELNGESNYTKDWEECQKLISEWQKKSIIYNTELLKIQETYKNKFSNMIDLPSKREIYGYINKINKLKTKYLESKYKLYLLNDYGKSKIVSYDLNNFPVNRIKKDDSGYNILILQDNKIKRVGYIKDYKNNYKLVTHDGIIFNNNIRIIVDNEFEGENVKLKKYYGFHQTKTTKSNKVEKIE